FSRMPGRKDIIPVSWSFERGAAVQGAKKGVLHARFIYKKFNPDDDLSGGIYRVLFQSSDACMDNIHSLQTVLMPLVENIKRRYGKECDIEFVMYLPGPLQGKQDMILPPSLVQIRPLQGISDITVTFPKKSPILIAEYVMSAGEYIGPWRSTADAENGWDPPEPDHYAYVTSMLEKTKATFEKELTFFYQLQGKKPRKDYDSLTPKKKAIVLTEESFPGTHALTIAHERGILCVVNRSVQRPPDDFKERYHMDRFEMAASLGLAEELLTIPQFDLPMDEISPYIHIVSDGVEGRVYNATREEAVAFAKKNGLSEPSEEKSILI
ncbi:MAG: hypothetical protein V1743_07270, partial [Nanoarchaeota archaeon]